MDDKELVGRPLESAFPSHGTMGEVVETGMALRDYFAAKAMQSVMSTVKHEDDFGEMYSMSLNWYEMHASHAYAIADAMLKARSYV